MTDSTVDVLAPTSGSVFEINVALGDAVTAGQEIMVFESMKMEIPVETEVAGTVVELLVQESSPVDVGDVVARIKELVSKPLATG